MAKILKQLTLGSQWRSGLKFVNADGARLCKWLLLVAACMFQMSCLAVIRTISVEGEWNFTLTANQKSAAVTDVFNLSVPNGYFAEVTVEGRYSCGNADSVSAYLCEGDAIRGNFRGTKTSYSMTFSGGGGSFNLNVTVSPEWYFTGTGLKPYKNYYCTLSYTVSVRFVQRLPDLSVMTFSTTPSTEAEKDASKTLNVAVKNVGYVTAAATTATVYDGETELSTFAVPSLSGGATSSTSIDISNLSVGNHQLRIEVAKVSNESSTGNNSKSVKFLVYDGSIPVRVHFDANGGTGSMADQSGRYGDDITLSGNAFVRSKFMFMGWSKSKDGSVAHTDGQTITLNTHDDFTLYAVWRSSVVHFDPNGGTGTMPDQEVERSGMTALMKNAFVRENFMFRGWAKSQNGGVDYSDGQEIDLTDGGLTLYAVWCPSTIVTFDPNGGSGTMQAQELPQDVKSQLRPNAFTCASGLMFVGWSTSLDGDVAYKDAGDIVLAGDRTLYAVWRSSVVRFEANGGTGSMPNQEVVRDGKTQLWCSTFTRPGYVFMGWATSKDGKVVYTDGQKVDFTAGGVTLYAVWQSFVVHFNPNGGSGTMPDQYFTDKKLKLQTNAFEREGYVFVGWWLLGCIVADGSSVTMKALSIADSESPSDSETLGARWGKRMEAQYADGVVDRATNIVFYTGVDAWHEDGKTRLRSPSHFSDRIAYPWLVAQVKGPGIFTFTSCKRRNVASDNLGMWCYIEDGWCTNENGGQFREYSNDGGAWKDRLAWSSMDRSSSRVSRRIMLVNEGVFNIRWVQDGSDINKYDDYMYLEDINFKPTVVVRFDGNGGSVSAIPQLYNKDSTYGELPTAIRPFATFLGWFTAAEGGAEVTSSSIVPEGPVSLYAHWKTDADIIFDGNGGTVSAAPKSYDEGLPYGELPMVTKPGATFIGWFMAAEGGSEVTSESIVPKGPVKLYAHWQANTYDITYELNGGTYGSHHPTNAQYDTAFAVSVPMRPGYAFVGWTVVDGLDDMTAMWGTDANPTTPITGSSALCANGTSGDVYFMNLTSIAQGRVTLSANWAIGYTVTYDPGSLSTGSQDAVLPTTKVQGLAVSLREASFERTGYVQTGWATQDGGPKAYDLGGSYATDASVTLYPYWTPNSYTVDFNPGQGGEGSMPDQPMTYDEESVLYANLFTRTGYTFLGWTDDENELEEVLFCDGAVVSNLTDEVDGEFDLYAIWTANPYSVRFDANGGEGAMADQAFLYDEEQGLASNLFVKVGHSFAGWTARESTSSTAYGDGAVVSNLTAEADGVVTLYAQWTANPYTVRFDANGGEGTMADQAFVYDVEQTVTPNSFTRTGYAFAGWALTADGAVKCGDAAAVKNLGTSGVTTLYAIWTAVPYPINYILGGGDNARTNPQTYTIEDAVELSAPMRVGWLFDGWEPEGTIARGTTGALTFTAKWIELPEVDAETGALTLGPELAGLHYGPLVELTCAGQIFLGWAKDPAGQVLVSADEIIPEGGVTLYPIWQKASPWIEDGAFSAVAANAYDGYVVDDDYNLVGLVQVKTSKQSVKKGVATITATATVTDANGKKWSYSKGVVTADGVVTGLKCTKKDCPVETFGATLGKNGMEGEWGEDAIFGARNGMGVKGDEMMAALETYKGKWSVTISTARTGSAPYQAGEPSVLRLQLNVGAKGAVKVAGNWESGEKVSASAQMVMGDGFAYVPVMVKQTKTTPAINALLKIDAKGEVVLVGEGALVAGGRTVDALGAPAYEPSALSQGGSNFWSRVTVDELAYPAKFSAKGLPSGLKINAATGVISGVPKKPGHYEATVTVTSGLNSKIKKMLTVEFDIANYTDEAIPIADAYGPYRVGVAVETAIPEAADCKVSGLPSGFKWTAKDIYDKKSGTLVHAAGTVYGVPTKKGTFTVYFKLTRKETVGGKLKSVTRQASATFTVEDLAPWAQGTFNGPSYAKAPEGRGSEDGLVTLTVGKTGKVSGKWMSEGKTWTLSAASYDAYISSEQMYVATVLAKSGKETKTVAVEVTEGGVVSPIWEAWRNGWKEEPLKTAAKALKGQKVQVGDVLLTVGANGAITAKGPFPTSCSTVLVPLEVNAVGVGSYAVYLYFPPKAGKFDGYVDRVVLTWNGASLVQM